MPPGNWIDDALAWLARQDWRAVWATVIAGIILKACFG